VSDEKSEPQAVSFVALRDPPTPYKKEPRDERSAAELIKTEWRIIDELFNLIDHAKDDTKKTYIYQTLQGHIRTLSMLLKAHGAADKGQDLAAVLSEITREAKVKARRLRQK
jgi:hypothetical protein